MIDDRVLWESPTGKKLHIERRDSTNVICGKIARTWKAVAWLSNYDPDDPQICNDCAYWHRFGEQ